MGRPIIERLHEFEDTDDFHNVARVYWTVVPAFTAANIVWQNARWRGLIVAYARKPFAEALAINVIAHVNQFWDGTLPRTGLFVLPGLEPCQPGGMDTVVLAGPSHLARFEMDDKALSALTIVAFPAYRSEFGGRESPELFDEIIHTRSDIGDWNRLLRPGLV